MSLSFSFCHPLGCALTIAPRVLIARVFLFNALYITSIVIKS
jgi:hypothetical protein